MKSIQTERERVGKRERERERESERARDKESARERDGTLFVREKSRFLQVYQILSDDCNFSK